MTSAAAVSAFALAGLCCAYSSFVLLFQSGERRAKHPAVVVPASKQGIARYVGWTALPLSWVFFAAASGVEVGTAIWLGVLALAGIISLLITAVLPQFHVASVFVVFGVSLVAALTTSWHGVTT
ncbi:MAG: DUF3325 family protein [Pseudomonadota bacterium]